MKFRILAFALLINISQLFAQSINDALKLMDMEQYGNAEKAFKSIVEKSPSAENYYYLGDFYLKTMALDTLNTESNIALAKESFIKGKYLDLKFPLNYVGLGAVKYLQNSWDSSAVYFEQATKMTKSKNAMVFYKIGEAYLYKGVKDAQLAVPQLEKAQSLDSKNTNIILALGDAYLYVDRGNATRAKKQYDNALAVDSKLAKAHIKAGKIYLLAKSPQEALKYYDKAVEVDPNYSPAYRERAELYFKFPKYREQAPAEYKKYLSLSDGNYKTKFRYAFFLFSVQDYDDAVAQLKELFILNPNDRILYRLDAYCNYEVGAINKDSVAAKNNFQAGLVSIEKFISSTIDTNKLIKEDYEYYGKLLTKLGNDTVGAKYIYKSFTKDTSRFEMIGELAKSFKDKKKYKYASQYYDVYYKYKKPGANDYLNWGLTNYNAENYIMADTIFSKLIAYKPEEPVGYKWKARCYSAQDKDAKSGLAIPYYEKFIEIASSKDVNKYKSDIISAYTYIGKYYLNVKKTAQSKEYWKKIIALDPNDANAKMVLSNIK